MQGRLTVAIQAHKKSSFPSFLAALLIVGIVIPLFYAGYAKYISGKNEPETYPVADVDKNRPSSETVELTQEQLGAIKIAPLGMRVFHVEKEEVGSVAYHEKESAHDARLGANSKFVVANVLESDSPFIRAGQPVSVKALAYPEHVFGGRVSVVGVTAYDSGGNPAIDPNTHRIAVRCEVADLKNMLYPGMLVSALIETGKPAESVAIPENGVVREGDGTMSAWVTTDRQHFSRRIVKTGIRQEGYVQILDGLQPGERAVTDGAVFVSNILYALPAE